MVDDRNQIGWQTRVALVVMMVMTVTTAERTLRAAPDGPPAAAGARALGQEWPPEAYRVEWEEAHVPQEAAANLMLAVPVTLRNSGNRLWPASLVFVAYHWFRDDKVIVWDGERTRLPRDVRSGGRASLAVRVKTPAEPGVYVLQITLVHENVSWFENKGANTFVRPIVVGTTTPSDDCGGDSTSCTATR